MRILYFIFISAAQIQSPPGSSSTSMDSYNTYPNQSAIANAPTAANYPPQANTSVPTESKQKEKKINFKQNVENLITFQYLIDFFLS